MVNSLNCMRKKPEFSHYLMFQPTLKWQSNADVNATQCSLMAAALQKCMQQTMARVTHRPRTAVLGLRGCSQIQQLHI